MNRVLLTGATGFIGRCCLPLLSASGYEVHAVSSRAQQGEKTDIYWHQADLLDSQQMTKLLVTVQPTHLLHLAWYVPPEKYWTSLENFRWVQASLELLQAFARQGGRRVVVAGTCAEYDWKYGYCSEQITPLVPATLYGVCKLALQGMSGSFAEQTGISASWGRIFFLYGPHEHPGRLVPYVIRSLLRGDPASCSHGNQIRDFLHVEDAASAFVALLQSDVQGAVNIGSGLPVVLRDIVGNIAEKLGRPDLIRFGEVATKPNDPPILLADVRRLREQVGWTPKYNLDLGLDQTIKWWKDNLQTGGRVE